MSGWPMLVVTIALYVASVLLFYFSVTNPIVSASGGSHPDWWLFAGGWVALVAAILLSPGFFAIQPNEARVLILFGAYKGTVRTSGFWWANPFYSRARARASVPGSVSSERKAARAKGMSPSSLLDRSLSAKISLRARNFNSEQAQGERQARQPVEIAAVVVWRVEDTAKAAFDVDDYESYVHDPERVGHPPHRQPLRLRLAARARTRRDAARATPMRSPRRCERSSGAARARRA